MEYESWYAMFVTTGREEAVRAQVDGVLKREGVAARLLVPKRFLRERKGGEMNELVKPMFPGYILVGTDDIMGVFQKTKPLRGTLRILNNEHDFLLIRPREIERILRMADKDGVMGESLCYLNENDRIVVISGALKGYESTITKLDRRKGRAMISFLIGEEEHKLWLSVKLVEKEGEGGQ